MSEARRPDSRGSVLNEVLSLNAQECVISFWKRMAISVLNEVLSLNAQESAMARWIIAGPPILNEVLSLNAQEYAIRLGGLMEPSSPQ